jgi:hypothetical protein
MVRLDLNGPCSKSLIKACRADEFCAWHLKNSNNCTGPFNFTAEIRTYHPGAFARG